MDKDNSASTQGYAAAVQHPLNLDNGKTKPKVKSGPQEKNKGASGKPNPPAKVNMGVFNAKVNTPISSLAPVSTLVSDSNTSILSVSRETTVAPPDGVEQKEPEEWIQELADDSDITSQDNYYNRIEGVKPLSPSIDISSSSIKENSLNLKNLPQNAEIPLSSSVTNTDSLMLYVMLRIQTILIQLKPLSLNLC
ncbi:unnamed protein product [Parnassius apollo]|uniref:(apollo) hypothetical protein n=1 Tax=Parnassius apollo TaxID=110799 RepID=A0A8S3W5M4_PARAO|nr:unnamed protein product [Parnassius apollo]